MCSFAGGKSDPSDRDVVTTALREAREELGVTVAAERVWGILKPLRDVVSGTVFYLSSTQLCVSFNQLILSCSLYFIFMSFQKCSVLKLIFELVISVIDKFVHFI